jgi:hypothetical protein
MQIIFYKLPNMMREIVKCGNDNTKIMNTIILMNKNVEMM